MIGKHWMKQYAEWDITDSPTSIKAVGWQVGTRVVSILEVAQANHLI